MNDNKRCWACGKTLTGGEKLGLCEDCLNKYGSPVAVVGILGLAFGGKYIMKNGGKIAKTVVKMVKK